MADRKKLLTILAENGESMTFECDEFNVDSGFIQMTNVKELESGRKSEEAWVSASVIKVFTIEEKS